MKTFLFFHLKIYHFELWFFFGSDLEGFIRKTKKIGRILKLELEKRQYLPHYYLEKKIVSFLIGQATHIKFCLLI